MRVRTHSPLVGALIGGLAAFSLVAAGCGNDTDEAAEVKLDAKALDKNEDDKES